MITRYESAFPLISGISSYLYNIMCVHTMYYVGWAEEQRGGRGLFLG